MEREHLSIRLYIGTAPKLRLESAPGYCVHLGTSDAEVIIAAGTDPLTDSARILQAHGYPPHCRIELWDTSALMPASQRIKNRESKPPI